MMYLLFFTQFLLTSAYAQPNCEAFLYLNKDTVRYKACKKTEEINGLYQFSKAYQETLDEALVIDPTFDYAYRKKSTAYLKSGDFITWKKLMDLAVYYNPQDNLDYRALMRFKCFRDYKGALDDFEKMDSMGLQTGHYDISRALCYNGIGDTERAIQILESHLDGGDEELGLLGYLHLGVFYLEQQRYREALHILTKQTAVNNIAENQYYLALVYRALDKNTKSFESLKKAKELYIAGNRMRDVYIDPIHKIYLEDINKELDQGLKGL